MKCWPIPRINLRRSDFIGDDLESCQSGRAEACRNRNIGRIPSISYNDASDTRIIMSRIKRKPPALELAVVPLLQASVGDELDPTILFQDQLRVAVGVKNWWAGWRRITLAKLIDEPWCLASSTIGSLMADDFPASGLRCRASP
jgi:hypothetical protein